MTQKKNYTLSTRAAASMLAGLTADGTEQQWLVRLRNWRKNDRIPPLTWDNTTSHPKYDVDELAAFAASQLRGTQSAAPSEAAPTAHALSILDDDGRPAVVIDWRDTSSSGRIAFSVTAADALFVALGTAVNAAKAALQRQVLEGIEMDVAALKVRSAAAGESGELPDLMYPE